MERDMEHNDRSPPVSPIHDRELCRDLSVVLPPPPLPHPGIHSPPIHTSPHMHPALYGGHRGSPIPLHLAFDKTVYSSPPQASNKPENNQCRLIDYRGAKVAAFSVDHRELICLPQAFDLFLKHLVGGLHTVYTKLKRLGITPVVCNVEQVRILRGLGAIQPGVNRCKLLAPKEFDVLYEDCTNSSARPGRPPKRAALVGSPDAYDSLKKARTEGDFYSHVPSRLVDPKKPSLFTNGYHFPPYHLPFMSPLTHPAMMNLAMANHLGMRPDVIHPREAIAADLSTRRSHDEKRDSPVKSLDTSGQDIDKPLNLGMRREENRHEAPQHLPGMTHPGVRSEMLTNGQYNMTRAMVHHGHDDSEVDDDLSDEDDMIETDEMEASTNSADDFPFRKTLEAHAKTLGMPLTTAGVNGAEGQGNSAIETLLLNILGLLKVAIENARLMEEQAKHEKSSLKMEMMKEKEIRENMEKQLEEEQKHIALLTKKLKRERRTAKRLQEQLERTGMRLPQSLLPQSHPQRPHSHSHSEQHAHNSEDDFKQAQEDLRKLNEISNRMSPLEERKSYTTPTTDTETKHVVSEPSSTSDVQNAMESLIMSTQRLPSSCHGSANGYLHSPIIKQAEAV